MNADQRIVVGVDGSDFSTTALRLAGRMARPSTRRWRSSPAWHLRSLPGVPSARGSSPTTTQLEETAKRLVDESLDRAFGGAVPEGLTRTVKFGPPAKVLVDESRDAQLLVVGRRGRGGFLTQVMGSVSGACVAHAQCPVLVVGEGAGNHQPSG